MSNETPELEVDELTVVVKHSIRMPVPRGRAPMLIEARISKGLCEAVMDDPKAQELLRIAEANDREDDRE